MSFLKVFLAATVLVVAAPAWAQEQPTEKPKRMEVAFRYYSEEARVAMGKYLTPLWEKELPKFKTLAKLKQVRSRHIAMLGVSLKALETGRLKIVRTRPDSNQALHEMQTWCGNLTMIHTVLDATEEDNVARGMADLQTAARLCHINAGLVTVAALVVETLDVPKETKPN